ncbi:MAG: heme ABC exporter ATP-binding protein CcmA [Parvibaculales bacterium]
MMRFETYGQDTVIMRASELTCRRGGRLLFKGLEFDFAGGQLVALRGGNGTGKTSLLRMMAGLLEPFSGQVTGPGPAQTHYIAHQNGLKNRLTALENLSFWQDWLTPTQAIARSCTMSCAQALEYAGLSDRMDLAAGDLSAGQKRRLSLARLLVAPRPVWLLDEPDAALDEAGQSWLAEMMAAHIQAGGLAVVATHTPLSVADEQVLLTGPSGKVTA